MPPRTRKSRSEGIQALLQASLQNACSRSKESDSYAANNSQPSFRILTSARRPGTKEDNMPLVQVKVIKGVFDSGQKEEMISQLTETMVGIEGESLRGVTWVTIEEVESGDWGIGGNAITAQYVKSLQKSPATAR